jgi:hypothetical protein
MMQWQRLAIRVVLFADFVIFTNWVVQYARVRWRETTVGRHLMAYGVVISLLLGLTLIRSLLGDFIYWLWLVGLVAFGAVGVRHTWLLLHIRRASWSVEQEEEDAAGPSAK